MKPLLCLLAALAFALSIAVRAWMRRREQQQRARQSEVRGVVIEFPRRDGRVEFNSRRG